MKSSKQLNLGLSNLVHMMTLRHPGLGLILGSNILDGAADHTPNSY